jgi:hypothetical protein
MTEPRDPGDKIPTIIKISEFLKGVLLTGLRYLEYISQVGLKPLLIDPI